MVLVSGCAVLAAAGIGAGVAPAHAAGAPQVRHVAAGCMGISPNIFDHPYNGGVRVETRADRPGLISVTGGSPSTSYYISDAHITIANLTRDTVGSVSRRYLHTPSTGSASAPGFRLDNIYTGPGLVAITVTATNRGRITAPHPAAPAPSVSTDGPRP